MKERPILFSGPMVRAILDGRKTQTRRPVKAKHFCQPEFDRRCSSIGVRAALDELSVLPSPFGQVGDRLWVRETWAPMCKHADPYCWCGSGDSEETPFLSYDGHYIEYRADTGNTRPGDWPEPEEDEFQDAPRWRPSIHMPRWASRITIEVTGVRVERLRDISEDDARAEGVDPVSVDATDSKGNPVGLDYSLGFASVWDVIYGEFSSIEGGGLKAWARNPWVWVVEFRRIEADRKGGAA